MQRFSIRLLFLLAPFALCAVAQAQTKLPGSIPAGRDGHLVDEILKRTGVLVCFRGVFLAAQTQKRVGEPVQ